MNLSSDFEFASRLQNEEYNVLDDSTFALLVHEQELRVNNRNSSLEEEQIPSTLTSIRRSTVQPRRSLRGRPYDHRNISSLVSMRRDSPIPDHYGDDYEGLMRLGEALGEARHKGLRNHEINQLPTFIFHSKTKDKIAEQITKNQIRKKSLNSFQTDQNTSTLQVPSNDSPSSEIPPVLKASTATNSGNSQNDCIVISSSEDSPKCISHEIKPIPNPRKKIHLSEEALAESSSSRIDDLHKGFHFDITGAFKPEGKTVQLPNQVFTAGNTPTTTHRQNYRKIVFENDDEDDDDISFVEEWEVVTPLPHSNPSSSAYPSPFNQNINIDADNVNINITINNKINIKTRSSTSRDVRNKAAGSQENTSKDNYQKCKNDLMDEEMKGCEDSCQVCLCDYEEGETLRSLPCLHHFHIHCIDPWITNNAVCPNCRFEIKEGLTSQL